MLYKFEAVEMAIMFALKSVAERDKLQLQGSVETAG